MSREKCYQYISREECYLYSIFQEKSVTYIFQEKSVTYTVYFKRRVLPIKLPSSSIPWKNVLSSSSNLKHGYILYGALGSPYRWWFETYEEQALPGHG